MVSKNEIFIDLQKCDFTDSTIICVPSTLLRYT